MTAPDDLPGELTRLGRALRIDPPSPDLVTQVLGRVQHRPARRRDRLRRLWRPTRRWVAVVVLLVLIALGLTPPVRAAIRDWFAVGGVVIRTAPGPARTISPTAAPASAPSTPTTPTTPTTRPSVERDLTLTQARAAVTFDLGLPPSLGPPERIRLSADWRVVTMTWGTGASAIRLDQFDGTLSWVFVKQITAPLTYTEVAGRDAIWIAEPHPIAFLDRDGRERTESSRVAGPSLVWEREAPRGTVTLRLEGAALNRERATALAASVR